VREFFLFKRILRALCWLFISCAISLLIAYVDPHKYAGYIVADSVLALIGALAQLVRPIPVHPSIRASLLFGIGGACFAFPIATGLFEGRLYLPHDSYQLLLVLFLFCNAAIVTAVLDRLVVRFT
jgi:hypothetical protein